MATNTINMRYYEAARSVPKEAQTPFNNGKFNGTNINPMWRIEKLTELFGPAGIGWFTDDVKRETLCVDNNIFAIVDLKLYVYENGKWSNPIFGTGANKLKTTGRNGASVSDEGFKMAYTDALSVACKALGIGADIYFEKDKTKYDTPEDGSQSAAQSAAQPARSASPAPAKQPQTEPPQLIAPGQVRFILDNCTEKQITKMLSEAGFERLEDMSYTAASEYVKRIQDWLGRAQNAAV